MRRRSTLIVLTLALGVLLALWLVDSREPAERGPAAAPRAAGAGAPDLLEAAAETASGSAAPALRGSAPTQEATAARGDVLVRVVGPAGDPLPGAFVTVRASGASAGEPAQVGAPVASDARGEVLLKDLPWDGSHEVCFWARDPERSPGKFVWDELEPRFGEGSAVRPVRGPALTYVAATGLWLHVQTVDAETGAPVRGARVRCLRARIDGDVFFDAPARFFVAPEIGRRWVHGVKVEAPAGYVAYDPAWITEMVSPYVERLEFRYPLRREVRVLVNPVDEDDQPVSARVTRVRLADENLAGWSAESDAYGNVRVAGIPWLRGEALSVRVLRADHKGYAWVRARLPDHPGETLLLHAVLPEDGVLPEPDGNAAIGIGGGARSATGIYRSTRWDNVLVVTVRRRDGSPARGCEVQAGGRRARADAVGVARFENLKPGELEVRVRHGGVLPLSGRVEVAATGTARLTLREGGGGSLEVAVQDEQGRPLPFARLEVETPSGLPWLDVEGAAQRLDRFTDHLGRRVLRHVEPGTLQLTVSWGGRRAKTQVVVDVGQQAPAVVVLPARSR